jgi:uncharacterized protein (DUF1697 family)
MRNAKLRGVFENIQTVISSGNVVFESPARATKRLEGRIENALRAELGLKSTTILRSKSQLQHLVDQNPFQGLEHSQRSSLNVTFLKKKTHIDLKFPYTGKDRAYTLLGMYDGAIRSVIGLTGSQTPDLMVWLEKKFGKERTTRTWKTVERLLKVMG